MELQKYDIFSEIEANSEIYSESTIPLIFSCGHENQIYLCNDETCKDHEEMYFCANCAAEDMKHLHKKVRIKQVLEQKFQQWKDVYANYTELEKII